MSQRFCAEDDYTSSYNERRRQNAVFTTCKGVAGATEVFVEVFFQDKAWPFVVTVRSWILISCG